MANCRGLSTCGERARLKMSPRARQMRPGAPWSIDLYTPQVASLSPKNRSGYYASSRLGTLIRHAMH